MDTNTSGELTLGSRLKDMLWDTPDILYKIKTTPMRETRQYEIQADLPAIVDPDIAISQVLRWSDLQRLLAKPLRIYAWSSNTDVEKWVLSASANISNIFVTVLPTYLREGFEHDE